MTFALVIDWSWVLPIIVAWMFGPILLILAIYWAGLRSERRNPPVSERHARQNAAPCGSVSYIFDRERTNEAA